MSDIRKANRKSVFDDALYIYHRLNPLYMVSSFGFTLKVFLKGKDILKIQTKLHKVVNHSTIYVFCIIVLSSEYMICNVNLM